MSSSTLRQATVDRAARMAERAQRTTAPEAYGRLAADLARLAALAGKAQTRPDWPRFARHTAAILRRLGDEAERLCEALEEAERFEPGNALSLT